MSGQARLRDRSRQTIGLGQLFELGPLLRHVDRAAVPALGGGGQSHGILELGQLGNGGLLHDIGKAADPSVEGPHGSWQAEQALRKLADERLLEEGKELQFYIALSEIMKRYAGRRYSVPFLEATTTEILSELKRTRLPYEKAEDLKGMLIASDIVKFARVSYPMEASQKMIPEGFRFVADTRPRARVETEAPDTDEVEARV